jgi:hypothetical protein
MTAPIPDFEAALKQFRHFVADVGHSPRGLLWIFREDVSTYRRRVLIRTPLPADNEQVARTRYEHGHNLGIGVCVNGFCQLGADLCCTTWFVSDLEESARRLCGGLKLSVPAPADLVVARPIRTKLVWAVRRWLDAHSKFHHYRHFLPTRDEGLSTRQQAARPPPTYACFAC